MKKFIFSVIFFVIPLVFSGCSLSPAETGNSGSEKPAANPNNSIWTSVDAGKSWVNNNKSAVSIAGFDVLKLVVNPHDENNVFVGMLKGGIFVTNDGGENWRNLALRPEKVYNIIFDSVDAKTVYASGVWNGRGRIFKSLDLGENWSELYATASSEIVVSAMAVDANNPKIIYAATSDNRLVKTFDGGVSWKNIFTTKSPLIKIVFDRGSSNLFYAMSFNGEVLRSKDGGENIESLAITMRNSGNEFDALEVDPQSNGVVYVGGRNGIHVSRNAGDNWDEIKTLNNSATYPVRAIAINPVNSREIIYGAAQTAYRSLNGGGTWEVFQFSVGRSIHTIEYSNNPARIYLGFKK
jgi:photosystem II stability/assembly factor-like uncharacterized protein